jgi:peptidoglycan hydrolase CwlO-like protein
LIKVKRKELLFNLIRRKPGSTFEELARELNLPIGRVKALTTILQGERRAVVRVYPTKVELETAFAYLNQTLESLKALQEEAKERERRLFEEVVKAKSQGLEEKAKAYALETANVRQLIKFIERSQRNVETMMQRVQTMLILRTE